MQHNTMVAMRSKLLLCLCLLGAPSALRMVNEPSINEQLFWFSDFGRDFIITAARESGSKLPPSPFQKTPVTQCMYDSLRHYSFLDDCPCLSEPVPAGLADVLSRWRLNAPFDVEALLTKTTFACLDVSGHKLIQFREDFTAGIDDILDYEIDHVKVHDPDHGLFLDIGGNVGLAAILMKTFHPNARVISFEPSPVNRFLFEMNLAANGIDNGPGGVELHGEAVSGEDNGTATITHPIGSGESANIFAGRMGHKKSDFSVPTISLQTVFKEVGDGRVDYMKLDCEGCEFMALPKMSSSSLHQIDRAEGEFHPQVDSTMRATTTRSVICKQGWHFKGLSCSKK